MKKHFDDVFTFRNPLLLGVISGGFNLKAAVKQTKQTICLVDK